MSHLIGLVSFWRVFKLCLLYCISLGHTGKSPVFIFSPNLEHADALLLAYCKCEKWPSVVYTYASLRDDLLRFEIHFVIKFRYPHQFKKRTSKNSTDCCILPLNNYLWNKKKNQHLAGLYLLMIDLNALCTHLYLSSHLKVTAS